MAWARGFYERGLGEDFTRYFTSMLVGGRSGFPCVYQ